jgi:hypothetical protein
MQERVWSLAHVNMAMNAVVSVCGSRVAFWLTERLLAFEEECAMKIFLRKLSCLLTAISYNHGSVGRQCS